MKSLKMKLKLWMRLRRLMSFENIRFEEPGYPILKAFVVPYRDYDIQRIYFRKVDSSDVEKFKQVLNGLKMFLLKILDLENVKLFDDIRRLELIADLIPLYFRIPLLREILPSNMPSPLKIYLLYRVCCVPTSHEETLQSYFDPISFLKDVYSRDEYLKFIKGISDILSDEKFSSLIGRSWFIFPSDTRPGFNTSGLIPHLLVTSAIAWCLGINEKLDRHDLAILRLASLLHDIGKPFNYRIHPRVSMDIARCILEGLISDQDLCEILEIINTHHWPRDRLSKILNEADRIASTIDRVGYIVKELIGDDIKKLSDDLNLNFENAFDVGENAWNFWCKIYEMKGEEALNGLNIKFLDGIRKATDNFKSRVRLYGREEVEVREYNDVVAFLIDVAGIQKYIARAQEIKVTSAASLFIDGMITAYIPIHLQFMMDKNGIWIPYETFIYTAGGIIELFLPTQLIGKFEEIVGEHLKDDVKVSINNTLSKYGLHINFAYTYLSNDIYLMTENLMNNLHLKKNTAVLITRRVEKPSGVIGYDNLCSLCYIDEATEKLSTPEGVKNVCKICKALYELGGEISFRKKFNEAEVSILEEKFIMRDVYGIDSEKVDKYFIEIISGHDGEELDKLESGEIKRRNISVIKIDGNLMGPFMATSISLTDMCERSARIDIALKDAISKALEEIYSSVKDATNDMRDGAKCCSSIILGLLYAGGDDSLIILPSWISLAFAWIIGNEFRLNMGNARGLSIGIAVGSAKANLWNLISASNELMEKSKKHVRDKPECSALTYDFSENVSLNNLIVRERLEFFEKEHITIQPFISTQDGDNFKDYITLIFKTSEYPDFIKKCYFASRFAKLLNKTSTLYVNSSNVQEEMKRVRTSMLESINRISNMNITGDYAQIIKLFLIKLYAYRQLKESKDERKKEAYRIVFELGPKKDLKDFISGNIKHVHNSSYADADSIIKIIGGGVI
ncbi:MAG: HD domain-containing protein [Candidatus Methanomethylicia archaeon]